MVYVAEKLRKYNLVSPISILEIHPSKLQWKHEVKASVAEVWHDQLESEAEQKTTLIHLNPNFIANCPHLAINSTIDLSSLRRVTVKLKLLTGVYPLQTVRAKFKQTTSTTCLLCKDEEESVSHFIAPCTGLLKE